MKRIHLPSPTVRLTLCLSIILAHESIGHGQGAFDSRRPQYAATYHPTRPPSPLERIRNTGLHVGDFIRRRFYGEPVPSEYQTPYYNQPAGDATSQAYSLDAPPRSPERVVPSSGHAPVYVAPPKDAADEAPKSPPPSAKAEPKVKSAKTKAKAPATFASVASTRTTTASKKRYAPARPSTFAKAKTEPEVKRVQDEPPAERTPTVSPSRSEMQDASTAATTTEAKAETEIYPLPGMPGAVADRSASGISPTIGGSELDLTPQERDPAPTITRNSSASTEPEVKSADTKSGSFMVGKKTSKTGRVVSPYPPYNELDITGLPSGSLALDPTTQKVFQVP